MQEIIKLLKLSGKQGTLAFLDGIYRDPHVQDIPLLAPGQCITDHLKQMVIISIGQACPIESELTTNFDSP